MGSFWPVAEAQAAWLADMLLGVASRPTTWEMARDVDASYSLFSRQARPPELYMQVDQEQYLLELWRAMTPKGPDYERRLEARRVAPFMELARERIARASRPGRRVTA